MGNYERYKFSVGITMSHQDFGVTDEQLAAYSEEEAESLLSDIKDAVEEELISALASEIAYAKDKTDNDKSYIHKENA